MSILCYRRHETMSNLAQEFGVSIRTILRDIEALSITEPIYTQCGRYGGGVYVSKDYVMSRQFMTENEIAVLQKIAFLAESKAICSLNNDELILLQTIIDKYTNPRFRKENMNENTRKRAV